MFSNQRGSAGFGSIVGVALVMALSILGTGLMVKVYRDGGASQLRDANPTCRVVCAGTSKPS